MKRPSVKIGDIVEIPLSGGRKAFGQYVFMDRKNGPLLQVFDLITDREFDLERLRNANPLFPPVITGLFAAVRTGFWRVVGHMPVEEFVYPKFVSTLYNQRTGKARTWFLWNGERDEYIGPELPLEYKQLEFLAVWAPHDIGERIETGEYPYPYGDLIRIMCSGPDKAQSGASPETESSQCLFPHYRLLRPLLYVTAKGAPCLKTP